MKALSKIFAITILFFGGWYVFADAATDAGFFSQLLEFIKAMGGMGWMAKIAAVCMLIVAATKVSFISPLWNKLPNLVKTLLAPMIALIGGLLAMGSDLTWASAMAYVGAGAGAIVLHEILDGIKTIPGIGLAYVTIIDLIGALLGGGGSKPQ